MDGRTHPLPRILIVLRTLVKETIGYELLSNAKDGDIPKNFSTNKLATTYQQIHHKYQGMH